MSFGTDGVKVRFAATTALDDVTVAFEPGTVTALVGGDGAGKTTLLRTLVGLTTPVSGSVRRPPTKAIGYLASGGGSWRNLTVDENIDFVGGSFGLTGTALTNRADDLLSKAGLTGARDRLAGKLSGGMRTKLGFTLAMLHEPDLLALDEPTTGIDPVSRIELWKLLSQSAAAGTTVVMSTTYMDEAERAGHVVVLSAGRVLLDGPPDEIVAATPGVVTATHRPEDEHRAWRVGPGYHEWHPDGDAGTSHLIETRLEDAAIIAELRATETSVSR